MIQKNGQNIKKCYETFLLSEDIIFSNLNSTDFFYEFFMHFRPFPSDKKKCVLTGFIYPSFQLLAAKEIIPST